MDAEGECTICHAGIRNVITEGGKIRELEVDPHPDGNHQMIVNDRQEVRARVLGGVDMPAPAGAGYRIHRCPPPPAPGPRCLDCGEPMDRALTELEGWTVHPDCEPEMKAWVKTQHLPARRASRVR